jgi:beta-mannanase
MQQSEDYLDLIPNGNYDAYINSFGQAIKDYQNPVVIRFGHEMNGDWYPWGQRPGEYIKAYRYIVELFRKTGVANVSFMWSINADNVPYSDIKNAAGFYPGDDVVDIIGIDGFNFGSAQQNSTWRSFKEIFMPAYQFAVNYGKPISISETASSEIGGNKAVWISQMFSTLQTDFPKIEELVWFNILKEADWRIDSSQSSLQAFKTGL